MPVPKTKSRQKRSARIPITITLDRKWYDFVLEAADLREFRSLDEFFESALRMYEQHLSAVNEYFELQESKGVTREEAMHALQCEILFTRPQP
jgi:hypothetical protein